VRSVEKILAAAGIKYTTLGAQELCCGSVLMRTGQTPTVKKLAQQNTKRFKELGAKKIVTVCPGCYLTLKVDYPKLVEDFPFEVLHISDFINQLLQSGKLKLTKQVGLKVTFHDPCHLGRRFNIYEPPRNVLLSIPGLKLVEMPHNRENSQCCGAGGGVKAAFSDVTSKIGVSRMEEAAQTKADLLVTSCPFCCLNLDDAGRQAQLLPVSDLTEIVAEAL
jgi:heterodisulfide reductase subunit D